VNPEVLRALITGGAGVNERNAAGMTALMFAAQFTQAPRVIGLLLEAGANPTMKNGKGQTARMLASDNESLRGTEELARLERAAR
jgi:ankyrin repeat protein